MWKTLGKHHRLWKDWKRELGRDLALIEGPKLISEAAAASWKVEAVLAEAEASYEPVAEAPFYRVEPQQLKRLTQVVTPQGVLAVARPPQRQLAEFSGCQRLLYLEEVQDPGNLGSIARSARAFGFQGLLLEGGVSPLNSKAMRASAGALLHLPWLRLREGGLSRLREWGHRLVGTVVEGGEPPAPVAGKVALVFGSEGRGLSASSLAHCDLRVTVPMVSGESLNVGVSAGILMYSLSR